MFYGVFAQASSGLQSSVRAVHIKVSQAIHDLLDPQFNGFVFSVGQASCRVQHKPSLGKLINVELVFFAHWVLIHHSPATS